MAGKSRQESVEEEEEEDMVEEVQDGEVVVSVQNPAMPGPPRRSTPSPATASKAERRPAARAAPNRSFRELLGLQEPANREQVDAHLVKMAYLRVAQFLLSLVSFASVIAHNNNAVILAGGAFLNWELAIGILVFLFAIGTGVLSYLCMGTGPIEPRIVELLVRSSIIGDLIFVFMTLSAFTAGAGFGIECVSSPFISCTAARLAAAFMFFLWLTFLYAVPLSYYLVRASLMLSEA